MLHFSSFALAFFPFVKLANATEKTVQKNASQKKQFTKLRVKNGIFPRFITF